MLAIQHTGTAAVSTRGRKTDTRTERFNSLVELHSSYLYRYAYWKCQNRALADDLVQETFLRAWRHLDQLKNPETARSWLTTIVRREFARLFERTRVEIDPDASPDNVAASIDHDTRPEAFALRQGLRKLPEKYREPLLLQVLGGFSLAEIATIMGVSTSAATTRLFRAREKMRRILTVEGENRAEDAGVAVRG
ncbi:MAG: sigma-70 family RNA polymerase sigma factor [Pseudomonadota bacterium]|nr:sigma-70 family RNA polymerase sigma factor [Pseudomonadota bacterium]